VTTPPRGAVGTAIQVILLLLLVSILAGVILLLLAVASLVNVPGQVAGGLGSQLTGVAADASRAASGAQQALQNVTDPNHPPSGLIQDNEFATLQVVHAGETLPGGTQYVINLRGIKRRAGADAPENALYAEIHAELRQPREIRLLGQLLRSDSDPHDHVVYKGETFRIARALYRVNWLSEADRAFAVAAYRLPDTVSAPLKFDYE
jgi:hypothetical protein